MKRTIFFLFFILIFCSRSSIIAQITPYMIESVSLTEEWRQGAAAYKKILFQFHNGNETIDVIDLKKKTLIQEISLPLEKNNHCNNAAFSTTRFDKKDPFPLLYVSTERSNMILVYRIIIKNGKYEVDTIQRLIIPPSEVTGIYFANGSLNNETGHLWLSGYTKNSWSKNLPDNKIRYVQLPLPKVTKGDVNLSMDDKISEFEIPWTLATQGLVFHKGKINQAFGTTKNTNLFRIINQKTGQIEKTYYPHKSGMDEEPEGTFIYKNKPMFVTGNGKIFFVKQFEEK